MAGDEETDPLDVWLHNVAVRIEFVREFHEDELDWDFSVESLDDRPRLESSCE